MRIEPSVTAEVFVEHKRQRPEEEKTRYLFTQAKRDVANEEGSRAAEWSGCDEQDFRVSR